jgi:hypothetical protein
MGGKIETASQSNSVSDCHRAVACIRYDSSKQKSSPLFVNFFISRYPAFATRHARSVKQSLNERGTRKAHNGLQSPNPWFYYRIRLRV